MAEATPVPTPTGTPAVPSSPTATVGLTPSFPRSVEVGDRTVSIGAEPVRIAALSTDVAEVILSLAGPERIVAIPEANTNPAIGSHPDLAASVPNHVTMGEPIDEAVLQQWGVDLVVISPNHSQEAQLARDLEGTAIPVLTMPNTWDNLEDAEQNILMIGEALGTEEMAQAIVDDIQQRSEAIADRLGEVDHRPVVLILTNVARVPFIIGPGVSTTDLVERAGGVNAADTLGVEATISGISVEQIIAANPDRILLSDGLGTGRAAFDNLLSNPALAEVPAIAHDGVLVLPARITFGVAHTLVDGLEAIAEWLHSS